MCQIDLKALCYRLTNVRYHPKRFPGLIWQHRKIGGNCILFSNGVINCNGSAYTLREGKERLRRYARRLQKLGYLVYLTNIKLITASAYHTINNPINLQLLATGRVSDYEPEIFNSVFFKNDDVTFCCFSTGKVIITGVKSSKQIENVIYPTLIELELYTCKKE